jgi:TetR/AcrR family transcriptional repressor of uid operon
MLPRQRKRAPAEVRRAQILEAALECFATRGYHTATMDDLARASGLSKGSLYWYFSSKEEVFLALFDDWVEPIFDAWTRLESEHRSCLDLVRALGEISFEKMTAGRIPLGAWAEFLLQPKARERYASMLRESRGRLAALVRRGIEGGEIRQLDPEGLAVALTATMEGLLLQAMVDADFDAKAHWPLVWEGIQRGYQR